MLHGLRGEGGSGEVVSAGQGEGDGLPPDWPEKLPPYAAPSGSLLMPEDIAEAALYWVSPASRPISGTVFEAEQYPMIGRIPNQENQGN